MTEPIQKAHPDNAAIPSAPIPNSANPYGPIRLIRIAIAGVLMGVANLIPGVSGGTMVLAMGLYQEFVDSVADVTSFRFKPIRIVFLGILGCFAAGSIVALAGLILYLLFHYPTGMYAAFIGLTLGGAPTLLRSLRPVRADAVVATLAGLGLMVSIWSLREGAGFPHHTFMDVISGVVGATTMVLPGVSGSYMLLLLDQYERVVGAVKDLNVAIIAPVGLGAVVGVIGLSHLLKFLLRHYRRPTIGVLLGILLGSVLGLWPFDREPGEKALERRSATELRAFAAAWEIPGVDGAADDELIERIRQGWSERSKPSLTVISATRALVLAALGFAATSLLARRRLQDVGERAEAARP